MSVIRSPSTSASRGWIEQLLGEHQPVAEHGEVVPVGVAEVAVVDVRVGRRVGRRDVHDAAAAHVMHATSTCTPP